ncbi:hypothetical protein [Heyndrickxia vini]|uniref:Uncharacterized protein n=1 Tax=Heyndrickxia vini TaxID=1476025 RepID=A0ABX7E2Q1_9BACI|nr:hypothetical protein [Heyndrickxia vini]QQZ10006.1 hypothetical protein I5776_03290 [Heyndrickxia vini]
MSGSQSVGGTANYTLTAIDQEGQPIPNYQFNLKLAIMDKTSTTTELYEVNDNQYKGSTMHPTTHQLVEVLTNHIGLTDSDGKVVVKIEYMPNAGAHDNEDGCFPIWYDENGNKIGESWNKTQTPPTLVK